MKNIYLLLNIFITMFFCIGKAQASERMECVFPSDNDWYLVSLRIERQKPEFGEISFMRQRCRVQLLNSHRKPYLGQDVPIVPFAREKVKFNIQEQVINPGPYEKLLHAEGSREINGYPVSWSITKKQIPGKYDITLRTQSLELDVKDVDCYVQYYLDKEVPSGKAKDSEGYENWDKTYRKMVNSREDSCAVS
ncbi:MAG: hypothetical protein K0R14_1258 [Burkholderiales bacterium]|jgi:hypothetical protein|nr:hypothetical protein [Burkholderiales bacterium]